MIFLIMPWSKSIARCIKRYVQKRVTIHTHNLQKSFHLHTNMRYAKSTFLASSSKGQVMKYNHILDAVGNTPIVKIPFDRPTQLYAKLEYLNPGGSVKDRSAKFMIEEAERTGILKPGGTIVDASSGNHGIATAMIGAAKGYKVIITVS
jgi:threonine synthase